MSDPEQSSEPTATTTNPTPSGEAQAADPKLPAAHPSTDSVTPKKLQDAVEAAIGTDIDAKEVRARVAQRVVRTVQTISAEFYRGPLPHPRHLKAYEDTCPGVATRIVAMAEKAHGRQEDRLDKSMDYEYKDRRIGLFLGFFALIALLVSGVIIVLHGDIAVGSALLAAGVIGTVIGTFVHGRRSEIEDTEDDEEPADAPKAVPGSDISIEKPPYWNRILAAILGR